MLNMHIYDFLSFMLYKLEHQFNENHPSVISTILLSGILEMCLLDLYGVCSYLKIYQELSTNLENKS